jgi:hypothetical protein
VAIPGGFPITSPVALIVVPFDRKGKELMDIALQTESLGRQLSSLKNLLRKQRAMNYELVARNFFVVFEAKCCKMLQLFFFSGRTVSDNDTFPKRESELPTNMK